MDNKLIMFLQQIALQSIDERAAVSPTYCDPLSGFPSFETFPRMMTSGSIYFILMLPPYGSPGLH